MNPREPLPPPVLKYPDDLLLDPSNPRLAGHELSIERQDEILHWLYRAMAVSELLDSIATNGYWQHEELFAAEEGGNLVVLEGNRRLCAVKLLLHPELRARLKIADPPPLAEGASETLRQLPVIIASRDRVWDYIGFKHVNGAKVWDSIAKAQYIYRVRKISISHLRLVNRGRNGGVWRRSQHIRILLKLTPTGWSFVPWRALVDSRHGPHIRAI